MGNSRASQLHALPLPAPEQVQVERRQNMRTGPWRHASASPDVPNMVCAAANWELALGSARDLSKASFLTAEPPTQKEAAWQPGPHSAVWFPTPRVWLLHMPRFQPVLRLCRGSVLACPPGSRPHLLGGMGDCLASPRAVDSSVKGGVNASPHHREFLGASSRRVCVELLASAQ